MNLPIIVLSTAIALLLTWLTTPDITENSIPFDPVTLVLRFGLVAILAFMALSMLARRFRKAKDDGPPTLGSE